MGRKVRDWKPDLVADATVAPHRYRYDGTILADGSRAKDLDLCDGLKELKTNVPYHEGEVVYVEQNGKAVKARIYQVFAWTRNHHGDYRETYHVQVETMSGHWSKLWERAYSGYIQRGYQRAGLASDVDRWEPLK